MYWIAATCGKDGQLKRAKWLSLANHVSDKHEGHGQIYPRCEHGPITESKKWIKSGSRAHKALRSVVESPYLLRDLGKLSPIHQTYGLEVFQSTVNHFAPKSTRFVFESMLARIHLAALHFNENSQSRHAMTQAGAMKYKTYYPKGKKGEEAVVKPMKEGPTYGYVKELLDITVNRRRAHPSYRKAHSDTQAIIGEVPDHVSSSFKKFDKEKLIERHKSRFAKK